MKMGTESSARSSEKDCGVEVRLREPLTMARLESSMMGLVCALQVGGHHP